MKKCNDNCGCIAVDTLTIQLKNTNTFINFRDKNVYITVTALIEVVLF